MPCGPVRLLAITMDCFYRRHQCSTIASTEAVHQNHSVLALRYLERCVTESSCS